MKKHLLKSSFLFLIFAHLLVSCGGSNGDNDDETSAQTGKVTFLNESSYDVKVHRGSFSDPVLLFNGSEILPKNSPAKTIDVRISDNNGIGTTFPIEYLYPVREDFDFDAGEVIASGFDFDMQIPYVIEKNKPCTVQIPNPNPKTFEFKTAFIKVLNAHNVPCELYFYGTKWRQDGNNNFPISPYKTGIYKNRNAIPAEGELYQGFSIKTNFENTPVPDFTMKNGFIYSFTYDGTAVHDGSVDKIFKGETK